MFSCMEHSRKEAVHGRGAQSGAVPTRFGLASREVDADWRDHVAALANEEGGPPVKLRTTVIEEHPRTILSFNQSPDIPFDRSITAYRGRSEERRVGKECVSTCRSRWCPSH